MSFVGKVGERVELTVNCSGYHGTYCGPGSGPYYGVVVNFRDENNNFINWYTTDGKKEPLPLSGKYKIKATVIRHESSSIDITHINRVKIIEKFED